MYTRCQHAFIFRLVHRFPSSLFFFFFNDTATTEIYTLSLHDALPISRNTCLPAAAASRVVSRCVPLGVVTGVQDRKSTRLNSSHQIISYAVFCLKKKKQLQQVSDRGRQIGDVSIVSWSL